MIYTCTLNPSIDYVMSVEEYKQGELNRAKSASFYPGGKGINVSRVLTRLEVPNKALGFLGGFTGGYMEDFLTKEGVAHHFIHVYSPTRINVKLKGSEETEINGPAPTLTEGSQEELLEIINTLQKEDMLILAGSLPSTLPKDFYQTISRMCRRVGVKVVVDTSGEALRDLLSVPLFLIKPNHHELGELFNASINSPTEAAFYGKKLHEQGVEHVIISMGGHGAVYIGRNHTYVARVPKGKVKNSVGAGDSVVAGFTAAIQSGKTVEESFKFGVAAGSATAFQEDLCKRCDVHELVDKITITSL